MNSAAYTAASSQGHRLQEQIEGYTRDMSATRPGGTIMHLSLGQRKEFSLGCGKDQKAKWGDLMGV